MMESGAIPFEELIIDVVAHFGLDQLQFVLAPRANPCHRDLYRNPGMSLASHPEAIIWPEKGVEGAEMPDAQHALEPLLGRVHVPHQVGNLEEMRSQYVGVGFHRINLV